MSTTETDEPHVCRLTDLQVRLLLKPLDPARVQRDDKGFDHVEQWDVRRWLNRVFSVGGWSVETISCDLVAQNKTTTKAGRDAHAVIYRAMVRLRIRAVCGHEIAVFEDGAVGENIMPSLGDAHDKAMKSAISGALKRCAVNLGDGFGLSLYSKARPGLAVVGNFAPYWQRPQLEEAVDQAEQAQAA
ncbi:Rad52/Rad22 family DNA repair protein [Streptoverticillium reticulum]|uniref:Rad52/Rad22 family DNA repair protein n=1 Tax=Streptoverticillium reticulum TaxID=1433415 RepID=UPI0039BFF6A2